MTDRHHHHGEQLHFYLADVETLQDTFAQDVAHGLAAPQKSLPAKYFYDAYGSQLYEQICDLPEYYLYRAEREILTHNAVAIHAEIGSAAMVELGAGSATKTRLLLAEYARTGRPFAYGPVDISRSMLHETAERLVVEYPQMTVHALHADFAGNPGVIRVLPLAPKAVAFFGSSLGNFTREESAHFFRALRTVLTPEDVVLLGIDLNKSTDLLLPAYDDAQGVTAAFNLNLLSRINRELGGTFDPENFEHVARYNAEHGRIEMHLRSRRAHTVALARTEQVVSFAAGETIHTENSYKYTLDEVRALGAQANLELVRTWFDRQRYFLVGLFRPA